MNGSVIVFRDGQSLVLRREGLIYLPLSSSCCQNSHSSCRTHHTVQLSASIAIAKRSLRILSFTIKALIIIPALSACSACLVTYRGRRKKRGLGSSFPSDSQGAVRDSAAQSHATALAGGVEN